MKKILYSTLSVVLVAGICMQASLKYPEKNLFDGKNQLDISDPERSMEGQDPEIMDEEDASKSDDEENDMSEDADFKTQVSSDSDKTKEPDSKSAQEQNVVTSKSTSSETAQIQVPTKQELQDEIKEQGKFAEKYKNLSEVLEKLSNSHGYDISQELKDLVEKSHQLHQKIVDLDEIMVTIYDVGFSLDGKLGYELLSKSKAVFKEAVDTTGKAIKELQSSLGLKPEMI